VLANVDTPVFKVHEDRPIQPHGLSLLLLANIFSGYAGLEFVNTDFLVQRKNQV
jgi:hypothetical protein